LKTKASIDKFKRCCENEENKPQLNLFLKDDP